MFLRLFSNVKQDLLYFYPIVFYIWFNSFNAYSWYSGNIDAVSNQQIILRSMFAFETYNLVVDGYYNSKNKLLMYHHIGAIISPAIGLLYYQPETKYINALVQLATINMSSNIFLCFQFYWKNVYALKIIFALTFFYCRLYKMFPYVVVAGRGGYICDVYFWQSSIITSTIIQLYFINWYWASMILKKMCYKSIKKNT